MHRRTLLTTAPLIGLGAALPPAVAGAQAQNGAPAALPAAQRFRVGDATVTALSDGAFRLDPVLLGIDPEVYAELMRGAFRDPDAYLTAVNAFAVEAAGGVILVDAGTGAAMGPALGQVPGNLAAAGHAPEDVTLILATHLHPDHVGGAVTADGAARFPGAELAVSEAERAYWTDEAVRAAMPAEVQSFFDLAAAVLAAYGDRLRVFEGEEEVAPGIASLPLPGHTPGHAGFMLTSGNDALLMWADTVHVPPVQLARPDVTVGFDVDPAQAAETRAGVLDRVAADRLMIAGAHMTFPGLANIEAAGDGYRAVPAGYPYPEG